MSVLIAFATIEGQTGKIARFAEDRVSDAGYDVTLLDVSDQAAPVSFDGVDKVILAAPVHERRHPKAFEAFIANRRAELEARHTLLLSVSLNAAFPDGLEDANDYLVEMKMRTDFTPDAELLVAGAVRSGKYDYFTSVIVRHVVMRGREYDPAAAVHEFTDWRGLSAAIEDFLHAGR